MELPGHGADDIALDGSTLWVARGKKLELWSLLVPGAPEKRDTLHLGATVRAVAVQDGAIGVATDRGFLRVWPGQNASAPIETAVDVCGVPGDVVAVGEGRWLVATTAGVALIRPGATGELEIGTEGFLVPGLGGWKLIPITGSQADKKKCSALDKLGCGSFCALDRPRRAAFDGQSVELARGLALVRLEFVGDGALAVKDNLPLLGLIRGVRSTAETAYLVVAGFKGSKEIAVSLGATMKLSGDHDVEEWVLGEQSGRFRARVRPGGRVQIAWVR